jgi:hypothetical protein
MGLSFKQYRPCLRHLFDVTKVASYFAASCRIVMVYVHNSYQ